MSPSNAVGDLQAFVLTHRWPDLNDGPWQLEFHWAVVNGVATCVGMSVFGGAHPKTRDAYTSPGVRSAVLTELPSGARAVRASDLRAMKLGTEAQWSLSLFETVLAELTAELGRLDDVRANAAETFTAKHRLRRGGWPADHLPSVAAFYVERMRMGSTQPTRDIANHWHVSKSAAGKWVDRCRKAGLLGPTEKGKPGGVPSEPKKAVKRGGKR